MEEERPHVTRQDFMDVMLRVSETCAPRDSVCAECPTCETCICDIPDEPTPSLPSHMLSLLCFLCGCFCLPVLRCGVRMMRAMCLRALTLALQGTHEMHFQPHVDLASWKGRASQASASTMSVASEASECEFLESSPLPQTSPSRAPEDSLISRMSSPLPFSSPVDSGISLGAPARARAVTPKQRRLLSEAP